jgi:flagellar biosynthesis/type III secretory pathway ATPase
LVEGDDLDEPIADEVRGVLDGHIVLSRKIAQRGQWPAIDVVASLSRLMDRLVTQEQIEASHRVKRWVATYERQRHLVELGAYRPGTDPSLDEAAKMMPSILRFLTQDRRVVVRGSDAEEGLLRLVSLLG